mmetsp:Transcript_24770/g.54011  ORF Transcript_24770/g.54011 Transcript_24770/m.54011 type:complete len:272 (-) Transcript_24770:70-885(-)
MFPSVALALPLVLAAATASIGRAFVPPPISCSRHCSLALSDDAWAGEVVSNDPEGRIRGCQLQNVGDSPTDWKISIDGDQADLGKFSEAIYKKITQDAKQQRFQGFRPGTIPPHLAPTYIAFAMDECAREATLEAMAQNNIRPFEDNRKDFAFERISIPPPKKKGKKKKKSKKKKKGKGSEDAAAAAASEAPPQPPVEDVPAWLTFETMKEAIDAGWKPGQSFSFVAKNVKGQQLKDQADVARATPIGDSYRSGSAVDWNAVDVASETMKE